MKPEKQLYQWDVNQYLTGINPAAQYVDYPMGNEVIRIKSDGTRCRIPDEVLQTYGGKTCYERYTDGTYRAYSFTVLYAPKPPDYVYTPEERTTFEALTARVDAAIDEIKRRADSGEFTPVKGVDYFTDAEKNELMESVSTGAIGEFRKVVDTATTEYNDNHNLKLDKYNANAAEKLTTYDTNAEQHTTDYNRNAAEKLEAYNQNHTAKVAEYNQNAETKTAEFDANAAALQTEVDRLRGECDKLAAEKANIDGYYEEMTVGDAEQLVATQFVEDNEPYLFRSTGGSSDVGNRAYLDKIVGGTVVWNQRANVLPNETRNGLAYSTDNGKISITGTVQGTPTYGQFDLTRSLDFKRDGRKYLILLSQTLDVGVSGYDHASRNAFFFSSTTGTDWRGYIFMYVEEGETVSVSNLSLNVFDITQMFGSTIADYIYSLEQSQAGAGVAWFKKLFPKDYYPYNAGELLSVEGLQSHDTVGFNQWDEALESGGLNTETGLPFNEAYWLRTKNFIPIFPSTTYYYKIPTRAIYGRLYFYDADKNFISYNGSSAAVNAIFKTPQNAYYMKFMLTKADYGTTYKHDICINLSDPSRNGEYEPYKKHSYPLDSSLTLRGIPKLDVSNNLYYDGDEYESDGTVTRKYAEYTFTGSENWKWYEDSNQSLSFWHCSPLRYDGKKSDDYFCSNGIRATVVNNNQVRLYVKYNSQLSSSTNMNTLFTSGTKLLYGLAAPTTETAEPFQHIQIVDDFGTEEFVSTGIVPVGHNTRYPANLRDKLQHLPSLASADGTYLIQQSGKQMSLIHMPAVFPDAPTEDGTYTLKTVVTGGTPTYVWEGVNAESGGK